MLISAYIPCYNNASTIGRAIASIRHQTLPVDQLLLVDDGSSDASASIAAALGVEVIAHPRNLGRGAARARAMLGARHELVLCCDGTKIIEPEFVANALPWFGDESVAAVVGSLVQAAPRTVVERWRGRHLFKDCRIRMTARRYQFASWGALVRKSAVLAAGNYDHRRRDNEDGDLGRRLLSLGFQIISARDAVTVEIGADSVSEVLERHWRWGKWNQGRGEDLSWETYRRWVADSIRIMAREDLKCRDALSIPISLYAPHYRYWRSLWHKLVRRRLVA